MRAYRPPNISNPKITESTPGSIFTPAIAAWSNPGALGALPAWSPWAIIAGLLGLAYLRKIPWWAGVAGAGAVWWFMKPGVQSVTNGVGIVANGTTLQLTVNSPGTLGTDASGNQYMMVAGTTYPVLSTEKNTDGTITYYLDNPA